MDVHFLSQPEATRSLRRPPRPGRTAVTRRRRTRVWRRLSLRARPVGRRPAIRVAQTYEPTA